MPLKPFKRLIFGIVLVTFLSLLLAACGDSATSTPAGSTATTAAGGAATTAAAATTATAAQPAAPAANSGLPVNLPRDQVLVVDQIFRYSSVNNFNFYVPGPPTPTRQGLVSDTLWYLDQQTGDWINGLAADKPTYNADNTEMTVKLRPGVMWSDGVEFTADDVIYTVNTLKNTPGLTFGAQQKLYVKDVTKKDNYTVVFTLNEPNPRFHTLFTARYNAVYMMAKHVWEKAGDPKTFTNFPVVSLGAYTFEKSDPNGFWELFKRRDDWQKTTVGMVTNNPGPQYILTIFYGDDAKKTIALSRHNLDVLFDVNIEAWQAIQKSSPNVQSWFKDFPWAYPNELDLRYFGFNQAIAPYDNKDVRWALTLAIDIVDLQTNYLGGVTRLDPLPIPATGLLTKLYGVPLEPWLKQLSLDVGNGEKFQPYDATLVQKIAKWAQDQGYKVPTDAAGLQDRFGMGWWKYAPDISEKLLIKNGFKRDSNKKWLTPDGKPWQIKMIAAPDEADAYRMATGFQDQMKKFGIDVQVESLERTPFTTRQATGDFAANSSWGILTVNANPDLWQALNNVHSRFFAAVGTDMTTTGSSNAVRFKLPELDAVIDQMSKLSPDDPKVSDLGQQAIKLMIENMVFTPTVSFKKFTSFDNNYWTGWPTSESPTRQPLYWFMGGRFTFADVKPKK